MKKFLSLLLAAALAIGIPAGAFAEGGFISEETPLQPDEAGLLQHAEIALPLAEETKLLPPVELTLPEETEFAHYCDGDCVEDITLTVISEEEFAELELVAEEQQQLIERFHIERSGILSEYDFSTDYFYNQMTAVEKKAYDEIKALYEDVLNSSADLTSSYLGKITLDSAIGKDRLKDLFRCFYYSNPRLYHVATKLYTSDTGNQIGVYIRDEYQSYSVRAETEAKLAAETSVYLNAVKDCTTQYDKAKVLADTMCDNITYNLEAIHDQTIHGALIDKECVCNGFAMAYTYLCNAVGIECIGYRNHPHAWNKTKIGDTWYETDVTWMNHDDNNLINYTYFLNSYQNVLDIDTSGSHVQDEYSVPTFTLPDCPVQYDHGFDTGAVKNLTAVSGNGSIKLTWDAFKGASGYYVRRHDGNEWADPVIVHTNSYNDYDDVLTDGSKYYYVVYSYTIGWGESANTGWVPFTAVHPLENITATYSGIKMNITWDKEEDAVLYSLWKSEKGGSFVKIAELTDNSYIDTDLEAGKEYGYCVSAKLYFGKWTDYWYMNGYTAVPASTKPQNVKAVAGDGRVALTWNAADGATQYVVYVGTGTSLKVYCTTTALGKTVSGLANGTEYTFLVRACIDGVWNKFTADDYVYATPVGSPKPVVKAVAGDRNVALTWGAVDGATEYVVYVGTGTSLKVYCTTTALGKTVSGLANGTEYTFLVRAKIDGVWTTFTSADYVYATPVGSAKPVVKAVAGDGKVALTWGAVDGATEYVVYVGTGTSLKVFCTTTALGKTVSGLVNGTEYTFLVRAKIDGSWTKFTAEDYVYAKPEVSAVTKPVVKAVAGDGKVALTWGAVTGATQYVVYVGTGTSLKVYCTTTALGKTVSSLKNGTEYTFLVRAYVDGAWTKFTAEDYVYATPNA